jgi:hypothetical protein
MQMKYSVEELIQVLEENSAEHDRIYEEAMVGFRETVEEKLLEALSKIQTFRDAGEEDWNAQDISEGDGFRPLHSFRSFMINVTEPEYHGEQYERVIQMLRMTTDKEIVLSEEQFSKYVLDEWDWKDNFSASTAMYMDR